MGHRSEPLTGYVCTRVTGGMCRTNLNEVGNMKKLSGFNRFMLIYISILCVVLLAISLLQRFGLCLIATEAAMLGCILMVVSLLVWGAVTLCRRVRNKSVRIVAGLAMGLVILLIGSFSMTYVLQFSQLALPHEYATITSPEGKTVVVMAAVDSGVESPEAYAAVLERMDARAVALTGEHLPEGEDAAYPRGSFGYVYTAYPKVMGIFYRQTDASSGVIYRGCESQAKLLYEWADDGSVRFYLENPEVGDSGEIRIEG